MTTIWRATVLVSLCLVTAACQTGHPRADESFAVPSAEEPAPWTELTRAAYADLPAQLPEGSTIEAIAQAPSGYVAVGGSLLSGDGIVLVSAEGINWSVVSDADLADVHLAEAAANGTQLVAVGTGSASGAPK